jgi:hypothetical protein
MVLDNTVEKGGRIEVLSPKLPAAATVEINVLIESPPPETQTERWLRLATDDKQLEQARQEFAAGQWVELEDDDELEVLLNKNRPKKSDFFNPISH